MRSILKSELDMAFCRSVPFSNEEASERQVKLKRAGAAHAGAVECLARYARRL